MLKVDSLNLPETVDGWKLAGPPQKITPENIFDYLDGGGELYLAYRFNRLLVWKYQAEKDPENEILLEAYEMQLPDEAFGLLSLDWTGQPVWLNETLAPLEENLPCPSSTALYGEGLLRARVGNIFLRILAPRETTAIKEIILRLGKLIASQSSAPVFPDILKVIRPQTDSRWQIRKDRTSYFHSHLILNSLYYISHENILNLEPASEALYTEWNSVSTAAGKSVRLIIINYHDNRKARAAVSNFLNLYLTEKADQTPDSQITGTANAIETEEGWLGWKISGNFLALVFEAQDREAINEILNQIVLK